MRLDREFDFDSKRARWQATQAVQAGKEESEKLIAEFGRLTEEINSNSTHVQITFRHERAEHCVLIAMNHRLCLESYQPTFGDDGKYVLHIWLLQGGMFEGPYALEEPTRTDESRYQIDLGRDNQIGWREDARFFTSTQIADLWMKNFLRHLGSTKNT